MLYQGSFQNGKELHAMSEKRREIRIQIHGRIRQAAVRLFVEGVIMLRNKSLFWG